jgi:hypothetical protein
MMRQTTLASLLTFGYLVCQISTVIWLVALLIIAARQRKSTTH